MSYLRRTCVALVSSIVLSASAFGQSNEPYAVPRTADGHPDFQGVWATEFLTGLERPTGVEHLVADPEQARALVATIRKILDDPLIDPDLTIQNVRQLAMVRGDYRTSVIVEPADGQMPLTQAAVDLLAKLFLRFTQEFDHPEQRPLFERCMQNYGAPPIYWVGGFAPHQIVQTRDHVVIVSEARPVYASSLCEVSRRHTCCARSKATRPAGGKATRSSWRRRTCATKTRPASRYRVRRCSAATAE
jgi:hypothetical protein